LAAQPDQHSGRIHPIERTYSAGYLDCFIALLTLQGLNKKHSVVNLASNAGVPMDAFALNKKLLFHGELALSSRRTARASRESLKKDPAVG
jgi:hypothetical protein